MGTATAVIDGAQSREFISVDVKRQELCDAVARYSPSFHRQAMRCLGNAADADDAVQSALLLAVRHLDQFRGDARMSTWISRIVINSARAQIRKRSCEKSISIDERPEEGEASSIAERLPDPGLSPEEACRRSDLSMRVTELAKQLPSSLRTAFQLRYLDGLTIREMMESLGVTEGAVKSRISRARKRLRRLAR